MPKERSHFSGEKETILNPLVQAVTWADGACRLLDQTKLPKEECYLDCHSSQEVADAIAKLVVRGAPAIGVAGAYGVVLAARESLERSKSQQTRTFEAALETLAQARPTAVNLRWATERMKRYSDTLLERFTMGWCEALLEEARRIHEEDIEANRRMAKFGAALMEGEGAILTVCNTGDLATGGIGTAFGVLKEAIRQKRASHIYTCETRPVMQGLRLTTWELEKNALPYTAICDNMAATVMRTQKISAVITGADRIARNGDVANKIGTYGLAVLAHHHRVPFFVAAPSSTFDLSIPDGEAIPIEQRHSEEILSALGANRPPFQVPVFNPAFDVTPHDLISALICEHGVIQNPTAESVTAFFRRVHA